MPHPFIPSAGKNRHQHPARSSAGAKAKTEKRNNAASSRHEVTQKCINCLNSSTATPERRSKAFAHLSRIHGKNAIPRLVYELGLTSAMNALHRIDPFDNTSEVSSYLDAAFFYAQRISVRKESQKKISTSLLKLETLIEELETPSDLTRAQKQIIVQEANSHAENVLTKLEISRNNWGEVLDLVHRLKQYSTKSCSVDLMLLNAAKELKDMADRFIRLWGDQESRKIYCRIRHDLLPLIEVSGFNTERDEDRLRGLQTGTSAAIDVIDLYAKMYVKE